MRAVAAILAFAVLAVLVWWGLWALGLRWLDVPSSGDAGPAPPADFTVRGRWADATAIRYRVEAETVPSPVPPDAFVRAVERAAAAWNATGVVCLQVASPGARADVAIGFRRGHHGACEPFGPTSAVAHSGPPEPGTFVHFDAARAWSERGETGHSLFATALHELGHVIGLGHAEAKHAVMNTEPVRPEVLSRHELAAVHSLYGGGRDGAGDLAIVAGDGVVRAVLRGVAPAAHCAFAVFDADGDGAADVIVWRTDAAGHGSLRVYAFGPGPQLRRTIGPFVGATAPGARVGFVRGPAGERLLVAAFANGTRVVRQFDRFGAPDQPSHAFAEDLLAAAAAAAEGDLDGDGAIERVARSRP
jgi:hypothetical protein